ncbi:penicillin-binding protein 2 [Prolixibacteraceae bacterium JC049]|nr:penicillin-binding protein 2 [Prolixibacteraceae bacterium JC049]
MDTYSKRKYIIGGIFVLIGIIFMIKLFRIQVLNTEYKQYAEKNILRKEVQYPSRGLIYDRNGELLVYNQAAYDLMIIPRQVKAFDTIDFCNIIDIEQDDLVKRMKKARRYSRYKPSILVSQITAKQHVAIQEKLYKFPGFFTQRRTLRDYRHNMAAHVLGSVGEVNSRTVKRNRYYRPGDYIGLNGVERSYEEVLRGTKGVNYHLVNVRNQKKGRYKDGALDTLAVRGKNITLSLDSKLQAYAEKLMQNKKGSIVAIEPSSGEILCLVSSPGYDPNLLVGRERGKNYMKLYKDTLRPIFNRALMANYSPGSTFKMANALIGLQERLITPKTEFKCYGAYTVGNLRVGCHHSNPFGTDMLESIEHSCNTYYCNVFRWILEAPKFGSVKNGYIAWRNHLLGMGFGKKLGSDFPNELPGLVPSTAYYDKTKYKGRRWRSLWIISLAIGQGELGATPLQMTNYAAYLANRGYYYIPHIVKGVEGETIDKKFLEPQQGSIDSTYFKPIIQGMHNVSVTGTGRFARIPGIEVCGKTGTVENAGQDHGAYMCFAPVQKPKIAVTVYVENSKWGSTYAAPIASLVIEKYINDSIMPSRKYLEKRMLEADIIRNPVKDKNTGH